MYWAILDQVLNTQPDKHKVEIQMILFDVCHGIKDLEMAIEGVMMVAKGGAGGQGRVRG